MWEVARWSVGRSVPLRGSVWPGLPALAASLLPGLVDKDAGGGSQAHRAHTVSAGLAMKGVTVSTPLLEPARAQLLGLWVSGSQETPALTSEYRPSCCRNLGL